MLTSSCKAKGRALQKMVVQTLIRYFPSLTTDDIVSRPMGSQGTDVMLSSAALKVIPLSIECKNTERVNIWAAIDQAEANRKTNTAACVIIKRNHTHPYVIISLDTLMRIMTHQPIVQNSYILHKNGIKGDEATTYIQTPNESE